MELDGGSLADVCAVALVCPLVGGIHAAVEWAPMATAEPAPKPAEECNCD